MDDLVNSVKSQAINVLASWTPILKDSKFRETGVLTPDEFVVAGDNLVHHCPTWQWAVVADTSRIKEYLPKDKQFLITRNVPCYRRCRQMEYDPQQEKILEGDEGVGDDWVDTHHFASTADPTATATVKEMTMDTAEDALTAVGGGGGGDTRRTDADDDDDDDAPAVDMEALMESGMMETEEDPNAFVETPVTAQSSSSHEESNVLETRTYDLNITYDRYYQTPRMWLCGYNEKRQPLSVDELYEDFSADHAKKTITVETHPFIPGSLMASIHPCRHAEVMKRLIEQLAENGRELGVHQYLLIFLKFVQAVIPTIEYDYTRSIQL